MTEQDRPSASPAKTAGPVRVVLADDHRLMLDGVRRALEADGGFEIVGTTQDGSKVPALVSRTRPDLVLLDVRMPQLDGLACLDEIRGRFPEIKVVMLSASTSRELVDTAFRRGASAYLAKSVDPGDLPATLRRVMDGSWAGMTFAEEGAPRTGPAGAGLTERETSIMRAVARGLSNDEIAKELWITQQTVKFHLTNAFRKLGAKNRTDAARLAYEQGVIENPLFGE
jgi:DNA-binding NarL/FixJ family response regulator